MLRKSRLVALTLLLALLASVVMPAYAEGGPVGSRTLVFNDGREFAVQDLLDMGGVSSSTPLRMAGTPGMNPAGFAPLELPGITQYVSGPEIVEAMPVVGGVFPPDARYWARMHWVRDMDEWGGPNDSVAYLDLFWDGTNERSNCTGWLLGSNILVTSGHCLYQPSRGGFVTAVKVYFGLNGPFIPFYGKGVKPIVDGLSWSVPDAWYSLQDVNADYGVIIVDDILVSGVTTPIGDLVGGFGWRTNGDGVVDVRMWPFDPRTPNQWYKGKFWTLGYPNIDFNPGPLQLYPGEQYKTHNDKAIWGTAETSLLYYLDTGDGWGGAPIYQDWKHWEDFGLVGDFVEGDCWGRAGGPCFPTVVAIHQGRSVDECWDPADPTIVGPCYRCRDFDDDDRYCEANTTPYPEIEIANRGIRITNAVALDLLAWLGIAETY